MIIVINLPRGNKFNKFNNKQSMSKHDEEFSIQFIEKGVEIFFQYPVLLLSTH